MRTYLVEMGPYRFVIEAEDRGQASAELDRRLDMLGLERRNVVWTEQ